MAPRPKTSRPRRRSRLSSIEGLTKGPTEEEIHIVVVARLRLGGAEFFHPPNEGKHKPQYRKKLYRKGVSPGVPDVILMPAVSGGPCAALELKKPGGRPTKLQHKWLARMAAAGWVTGWADTVESALAFLRSAGYRV